MGQVVEERAVSPNDAAAVFTIDLQPGHTRIETRLLDEDGEELCGAYYCYVRRLQ